MAARAALATARRLCAALCAAAVLALAWPCSDALAVVELSGIEGRLADNVLAYLRLDDEPCDTPQWRIEQRLASAPERIREALQALGYYEPTIDRRLELGGDCWRATFTIAPGEPVRIRGFDVLLTGEAERDAEFALALEQTPLQRGAVLDHGAYEGLKRRWSDLARERGYADAAFTAGQIDVYTEQHAADIVLRFDSGARYDFGEVRLSQDVLTERLVRSYVPFREGQPYDGRQLTALYVALADSGYFGSIDVQPLPADHDLETIPVRVALTGAPRRQITYGVGFSTDTGPRLRFGRNNRRFNEQGHQFGLTAQLSPVISEVAANYRMPYGDPRTDWVNFDAGVKREDTESALSRSMQLGARIVRQRPRSWTRTQLLSLLIEDFEIGDQSGRSRLLMPGMDFTRIRADNSIRPSRGSRLSLEVRGASDTLGSDTTFAQTIVHGKWIWSTPRGQRFLVRGQLGATAKRELDELPPSVRFFAGGDNSVRGYDFEALGPVDANGKVIGGSSLAEGSFEFEQPLIERWSLAFFVDSGNAFEGSTFDTRTGAGIGGRWRSPLGPIRVDLAHPFDDPADSWRLHISLGPDL